MEGESGVSRSVIDEIHCWIIQESQRKGESGGTLSFIDELVSWDIQRD